MGMTPPRKSTELFFFARMLIREMISFLKAARGRRRREGREEKM
jgi:hypothetical protein